MKQDKLEKFVLDNREEFDLLEPDDRLWDKINKVEKPEPRVVKLNWRTIAVRVAAVVVIFVASYFFHDLMQNRGDQQIVLVESEDLLDIQENENVQVLMEAEVFYTSQINSAKDEIIQLSNNDHSLLEEINYDLVELDDVFKELKNDLKDNGDNEEVIEAMIQNYRIKLEILDEILTQLRKSKNVERNENNGHEI